jgi:hypothetical protein
MQVAPEQQLERYHPLLLHSVLSAVRRFEPDFYAHLCRAYHLDADRILGLFSEVDQLGAAQLHELLAELRQHQAYFDIMFLAGRNALHSIAEQQRFRPSLLQLSGGRFGALLKHYLPQFLGLSSFVLMVRGDLQFVEIRDTVFSRGVRHERPLCSFYAGFCSELGGLSVKHQALCSEIRCRSVDGESQSCLFQVSL